MVAVWKQTRSSVARGESSFCQLNNHCAVGILEKKKEKNFRKVQVGKFTGTCEKWTLWKQEHVQQLKHKVDRSTRSRFPEPINPGFMNFSFCFNSHFHEFSSASIYYRLCRKQGSSGGDENWSGNQKSQLSLEKPEKSIKLFLKFGRKKWKCEALAYKFI